MSRETRRLEEFLRPDGRAELNRVTLELRTRVLRKAVELAARSRRFQPDSEDVREAIAQEQRRSPTSSIPLFVLLTLGLFQASVLLTDRIEALPLSCQVGLWITPAAIMFFELLDFALKLRGSS